MRWFLSCIVAFAGFSAAQAELRDYVRDGGLFEARRQETGADCTYEVLQRVMGVGFLQNLLPGAGGPLAGLGGLAEFARVLERNRADHGWDDWEEPPRRKHRSEESDWGEDDGSGATRASKKHDNPDWATDPDFE